MLRDLSAYIGAYLAVRPSATSREARAWTQATGLAPETAAALAGRGWTPDVVAARMQRAYEEGDERDQDRVVDEMLHGPGPDA